MSRTHVKTAVGLLLVVGVVAVLLVVRRESGSEAKPSASAPASASARPRPPRPPPVGAAKPFKDTEGRAFDAYCDGAQGDVLACDVREGAGVVPISDGARGEPRFALALAGRHFLAVCDGFRNGKAFQTEGRACRPVVCQADADCPRAPTQTAPVACTNGLCADAKAPTGGPDIVALCMAGLGPRWDGEEARTRLTRLRACPAGVSCEVPRECRQP